ncbi:hypothetical protein BDZ45DRAFT_417119 [Acephala macrosclerotiorum]|nr:hypothetical protein BDZ45DRAFT_417119 [Acephala macrosclerotiorum]
MTMLRRRRKRLEVKKRRMRRSLNKHHQPQRSAKPVQLQQRKLLPSRLLAMAPPNPRPKRQSQPQPTTRTRTNTMILRTMRKKSSMKRQSPDLLRSQRRSRAERSLTTMISMKSMRSPLLTRTSTMIRLVANSINEQCAWCNECTIMVG